MAVRSHSHLLHHPQTDNRGGLLGLTASEGLFPLCPPPTPHHWDQTKPTPCTKSPRGATRRPLWRESCDCLHASDKLP